MAEQTAIWCVFLFFFSSQLRSSASTPVLLWTNSKEEIASSLLKASLGHEISLQNFQDRFLKSFLHLSSKSTVLFLQDKLSLDDFAKYSNKVSDGKAVFENLKNFLGTKNAFTVPSVMRKDKESMVKSLKSQHNGQFEEVYSSDIDMWKYRKDKISMEKKNLFVFHLPPVKGSTENGKISVMSSNDLLIGKILKQFSSDGVYTALLTSTEPSDIVDKMQSDSINDDQEAKRHLLSTKGSLGSSNTGPFYNFDNCVYLYATDISFRLNNETVNFNQSTHTLSGNCALKNMSSSISVVFGKPLPTKVTKFDLRMNFDKLATGDWVVSSMQVTYSGSLNNGTVSDMKVLFSNTTKTVSAPVSMAYSCAATKISSDSKEATLTFKHFQVQPFGIQNKRFSNAYDCSTFFTIPILTGLFVSAILLSVLFGGIIAMLSISTMDRFDDPKGPCIQVPHE